MAQQVSKLQMVSFGLVAANKPLSTREIEVTPIETLNMANGELTDNLESSTVTSSDSQGAISESVVKSSVTVTAVWLPFGSNRATPPDVRRGEKVCIWKYADADKYYWSELEYDGKLRRLETIVWMISDTQSEDVEPAANNTYFFEWSTHTKIVHLHTAKSDGEPFTYDIQLNTREGNFRIMDDIGNIFFMDSKEKQLLMQNVFGTFIQIDKKNININAVQDFNAVVGGNMNFQVAGDWSSQIGGKTSLKSGGGFYGEMPESSWQTPKFSISGDTSIGGNLSVTKNLSFGGGAKQFGGAGGTIEFNGPISSTSGAHFASTVTAPNFNEG